MEVRRHVVEKWVRMRGARGDALAGLEYEHLLDRDAERESELRCPAERQANRFRQRTDSRSSPVLSSVGTMVSHSCTRGAASEHCKQVAVARAARTFFCHCGNVSLKSGSCDTPGHVDSVGVPSARKILNSWSISESPGNSGLWLIISTKMQPIDLFERSNKAQTRANCRQAGRAARTICPQACCSAWHLHERVSNEAKRARGCANERTKQNLGRAIPQRDHLVRVGAHRDACDAASQLTARAARAAHAATLFAKRSASMLMDAAAREPKIRQRRRTEPSWCVRRGCKARTEGSRETEVRKLEVVRHAVDQQILRLQVAVQHSAGKRGGGCGVSTPSAPAPRVRASTHRWEWQKATPSSIWSIKRCSWPRVKERQKSEQ